MVLSYQDWSLAGWRQHLPGVADVESFAAGLGDATIPALAAVSAAARPGRVAVTVDGEAMTHAELDHAASRVAGWLARQVRPGDRVLLAVFPARDTLAAYSFAVVDEALRADAPVHVEGRLS